ncbi:MAG TPA: DUF4231 domain-containing protein [Bryobacteraceae bacterium]|nr:DUF4231 domain-containing protein [Bryobacteraceae bacterium]
MHPTLVRLEDQIEWYDRKSTSSAHWYKRLKLCTLVVAAFIPTLAHVAPPFVSSALGALVLVIEGVQHLNQHQALWMLYRRTAEALKSEKQLYLARAGAYAHAETDPLPLLAERVEALLSGEQTRWATDQRSSEMAVSTANTSVR